MIAINTLIRPNESKSVLTHKLHTDDQNYGIADEKLGRMANYDQEYYVIHKPLGRDDLPSLSPDSNTEDRRFRFEKQPIGSPPLVFENGSKEYNQKRRVKGVATPPNILFAGTDLIVPDHIREALLEFDIPNFQMHPAVYIHDDGKWYEGLWYMTFTDRFDCWDRNTSNYEQDEPPVRLGGFELYQIYTHSLNQELLEKTPLEQRLLFKMGSALDAFVVCHKSLARLFRAEENNGVRLTLISDY